MPQALQGVVEDYRRLIAEAARHGAEPWSPSPVEAWKDDFIVTAEALAQFRRHTISGGTINFPDRPAVRPADNRAEFFKPRSLAQIARAHLSVNRRFAQLLAALPESSWGLYRKLARDDGAYGAFTCFVPGLGSATEASIRYAYYAAHLSAKLRKGTRVLEIGAGFGGLAERLWPLLGQPAYVITDLPLNLLLAFRHLSERFPGKVGRLWFEEETGPLHQPIQIVAPWRLDKIGVSLDAAINTMSFQHMSLENLRYYDAVMTKLGVRQLYHVNRYVKRDPTDVPCTEYPFRARFSVIEGREFPVRGWRCLEELLTANAGTQPFATGSSYP